MARPPQVIACPSSNFHTLALRSHSRSRSTRRSLVVTAVVLVGLSAAPAEAATTPAPSPLTLPNLLGPPPTTVPPPGTTTTTRPPTIVVPAPLTTSPPRSTAATLPPGTGVPMVPTGAPPITAPGGVAPPGPPPDPGPITQAVDSDLTQIAAIDAVARAQQAVLQSQETVAAVQHQLSQAQQGMLRVAALAQRTNLDATVAREQLAQLAIAAYTGEAYPMAGGASSGVGASGTVRTAFGTLGLQAQEADELVRVVADHELAMVRSDRKKVKAADGLVAQAQGVVAHVQAELGAAQQALGGAQQTLAATVHSATTPGAALAAAVSAAGSGPASSGSTDLVSATTTSPTVLGPSTLSAAEMAGWFASTGRTANASVPITQLAADYVAASQTTGVRGDLAFAQSIIETGYFDFPAGGQLTGSDNNFAGIGACDSCAHGWSFPSALTGVTAQEQLLEAYASTKPVATPLVGPVGIGGCCATWISLAGHWATDPRYGVSILTIYKQMLDWAIPYRLAEARLGPAPKVPLPAAVPSPATPAVPPTAPARAAP